MKIEINNRRKVFAVQEEFNHFFPNLKIEFYEKSNKSGGSPSEKLEKQSSKTLEECRTMHNDGFITISQEMSVGELKQRFRDVYGLSIDVLKKTSNNLWDQSPAYEKSILEYLNKL
ncbi:MAG: hypothetical protein ABI199_07800 [Bacteroidia bacterium]